MQDINIYIFGEEVPKIYPRSPEYKLVSYNKIKEPCDIEKICVKDFDDDILKMEHAYSEGARIHALWKAGYHKKTKYIGTAHYRRYFEFFDKVPNLDEIFEEHDAMYELFDLGWPSIERNYIACHNIKDLEMCIDIINTKFPEYAEAAEVSMVNMDFVPCNIFILKSEMFDEWCKFVFGVLDEYNKIMGFKTDLDVTNYVVNHMDDYVNLKGGPPNNDTSYQSRIQSFLIERLSSIFFKKNIHNPYYEHIVMTETHFEFEKTYFCQYEKKDNSDNS